MEATLQSTPGLRPRLLTNAPAGLRPLLEPPLRALGRVFQEDADLVEAFADGVGFGIDPILSRVTWLAQFQRDLGLQPPGRTAGLVFDYYAYGIQLRANGVGGCEVLGFPSFLPLLKQNAHQVSCDLT